VVDAVEARALHPRVVEAALGPGVAGLVTDVLAVRRSPERVELYDDEASRWEGPCLGARCSGGGGRLWRRGAWTHHRFLLPEQCSRQRSLCRICRPLWLIKLFRPPTPPLPPSQCAARLGARGLRRARHGH
jgi:hypothetical protein